MTAPSTKHLSAEWLSVYLDGQVTPAQRQAIETHLRACRQCAQEMQTLKQTVSLLHQVPQVAAPRPLTLREIEVQPAARPRRLWVLPYLQGATALATLLLVVLVAGDLFLGLGRMPLSGPQSAAPHAYTTAAGPQAIVEKVAEAERLAVGATVEVEAPVAPEIPEKGLAEGATPPVAEDQAPLAEVEGEAVPSMEEVNGVALEATASPGPLMRALGGEASATPAGEEKVVAEKEAVAPELTVSPGIPLPEGTPVLAVGMGGGAAEEPTPTPMPQPAPAEVALVPPQTATAPPAPVALRGTAAPNRPAEAPAPTRWHVAASFWRVWVRLGEILLLGAVLVLGGLTLLARRRR